MATGQGIDVAGLAQTVLVGVAAHFAESEVQIPDRQVIYPGEPRGQAWVCEELAVTCAGVAAGHSTSAGGTGRQAGVNVAVGGRRVVITVQIVRQVPVSSPDYPADESEATDAGVAQMRDGGLLSQALVELVGAHGTLKQHGSATAGDVEFLGPLGGFAAVEGTVTVTAMTLV